jgi:hypothetical protein
MVEELTAADVAMLDDPKPENSNQYLPSYATFENFEAYQTFVRSVLNAGDYEMIHGKRYITRKGWRKIACALQLSLACRHDLTDVKYDINHNVVRATYVFRAIDSSDRFVDGCGSCSRDEKNFLHPNHDVIATAETRAKNRAIEDFVGIGKP